MILEYLSHLGDVARYSGNPEDARNWFERYLNEARTQENLYCEIRALSLMGWAERGLMEYQSSQRYFEDSIELARAHGDQFLLCDCLDSRGYLAIFLGHFDQTIKYLSESVSIAKKIKGIISLTFPKEHHWRCSVATWRFRTG
jgi:tetratricopeptide (TPR) repeat protein